MNLEVFKMQVGGIKSMVVRNGEHRVDVMMADGEKPVVEIRKKDGAIATHFENFTGSGLDFGLLMMALSSAFTQNEAAMKPVKVFGTKDPNVIANFTRNGELKSVDPKNVTEDDLQVQAVAWLMRAFKNNTDDVDPLVALVSIARMVENSGMAKEGDTSSKTLTD